MTGQLDYSGIIVTEKSLYILDNYQKRISHDQNYVIQKVSEISDLSDQFINNGDLVSFAYESETGIAQVDTYIEYENMISVKGWETVK